MVGVVAAADSLPSDPDIYRPLGRDPRGMGQNLSNVCRLVSGASLVALTTELQGLLDEARRQKLASERTTVPYSALTRHESEYGLLRPQLNILLAAVALVLLAAAANTTGLLLVRASGRRREIGVRMALGASPRRIARTLLSEGLLLATVAGALGLLVAPLLVRGLLAMAPAYYGGLASFTIDANVVGAAALLCLCVGLSVSFAPLAEVLRFNLRDTLQEEGRSGTLGRRATWMRQLLVGAETAVSAVLLVGALLLLRTFVNLMNVDTGVDSRGVLTARMSIQGPRYEQVEEIIRFFEEGVARLQQTPGIEEAAVGASIPAERALNLGATFLDRAEQPAQPIVNWRYVSPGYFGLLHMRAVAGRLFAEGDRARRAARCGRERNVRKADIRRRAAGARQTNLRNQAGTTRDRRCRLGHQRLVVARTIKAVDVRAARAGRGRPRSVSRISSSRRVGSCAATIMAAARRALETVGT